MRRYTLILGTRPEAIKLLPLMKALLARGYECELISTHQHGSMLDAVYSDFGIYPDISLRGMPDASLLCRLAAYCTELEAHLVHRRPDAVIVQGDTLSAYAGAISAYLSGIEVYHVEAGLRTYDIHSPYPEEFIRRSIAAMATLHFAPDDNARINLLCEGVKEGGIFVTGNTVLDAIRLLAPRVSICEDKIIFTLHRRESEGRYADIFAGLYRFAIENPSVKILYPAHPRVFAMIPDELRTLSNLVITEPKSPREFYAELMSAEISVTDSGGITEECAALGIDALILRDKSERWREEASGAVRCIGCEGEGLYRALTERVGARRKIKRRAKITHSPVEKICDILDKLNNEAECDEGH